MKTLSILGATGSIGKSTLSVARQNDFSIAALTANRNAAALAQIARATNAELAVIADENKYQELKELLSGTRTKVAAGLSGLLEAAQYKVDYLMSAITGIAGLRATFAAAESQSNLALANKEAVVCGGALLINKARASSCAILPVDSEHHALHCLLKQARRGGARYPHGFGRSFSRFTFRANAAHNPRASDSPPRVVYG